MQRLGLVFFYEFDGTTGLTQIQIETLEFYSFFISKSYMYWIWTPLSKLPGRQVPYSREQKHVSISDTPMLLIEINSISNMGRQK